MKKIFLILAMVSSSTAFAVQTKHCPELLVVDVPEVEIFSKSFVDKVIDDKHSYDEDSVQFFQESVEVAAFKVEFTLESVQNSNCRYHNEDLWGGLVRANITGTDKDPKLTLNFEDWDASFDRREGFVELVMFSDTSVKRPFYDFSGTDLQIKATASQISQGETYPAYIPVGKAKISSESQKNYELGNERWSIDLLTETCPRKLSKEISSVLKGLDNKNLVSVLPETIGYKYFKVEFKELKNGIVSSEAAAVFEFEYSSLDDQHLVCDSILPQDFVY